VLDEIGSGQGQLANFCEHGSEPSVKFVFSPIRATSPAYLILLD